MWTTASGPSHNGTLEAKPSSVQVLEQEAALFNHEQAID